MNTVYPNGVLGFGKVRHYPDPREGESAWGYATRLAFTQNPDTAQPYVPIGIISSFGMAQSGGGLAEIVDRWLFPEDYWDQAEIDRRKRINDETAHGYPGGTGPYPVASLTPRDCQFLNWLSSYSTRYKDAWLKLVSGPWVEITRAMQQGQGVGFDPYTYDGPLQLVAQQVYGKASG